MAFSGIFAWTMDVWYCLLHYTIFFYMYKVLLVYSFVFHLICYCCLLILNVLCFSVCWLGQASIIVCEFSVQSSPQCWVFVLVLHSYLLICHSCDIILQALWTPVYVIVTLDCHVDMNGILRYFCLDHGCVVLLTTLYYFFLYV